VAGNLTSGADRGLLTGEVAIITGTITLLHLKIR
jgi:hypothetical protein